MLTDGHISLKIIERQDFDEVLAAASDKKIWEFYPFDGSNREIYLTKLQNFIEEYAQNKRFPFAIRDVESDKFLGITNIFDIDKKNCKCEIGSTWLIPEVWQTKVNLHCKKLLLEFCFENQNFSRVQLKTDERNIRSQKAIEKIGGKFEGVLRNDMIRDNGTKRNSVYYSIIEEEWPQIKLQLKNK